jgi:AcrR family transcriptional regulator
MGVLTRLNVDMQDHRQEPPMDNPAPRNSRSKPERKGVAEKLFTASREEFSRRGYHGARVQNIARHAGCNVALLYRYWASKKSLYLEVLRTVWLDAATEIGASMDRGATGAPAVVSAYLDALMRDEAGAQILVREYLDGAPFLSDILTAEPELTHPVARAVKAFKVVSGQGEPLRQELDPVIVALAIGALAPLVAAAQQASRPFLDLLSRLVPSAERWRTELYNLLLHGAVQSAPDVHAHAPERGT